MVKNFPEAIVVFGLPGSGKSVVSKMVVDNLWRIDETTAGLFRTDVIRKDMFDDPDYTREETEAVYEQMLYEAVDTDHEVAVLDGTFRRRKWRDAVTDRFVEHTFFKVECSDVVAHHRMEGRDDVSDATFDVREMVRNEFEPIRLSVCRIDNSYSRATTRRHVVRALQTYR